MAAPKRERPQFLSQVEVIQMPVIPTGNWAIDKGALRIGGFPCGRISEVFGAESGGKTTLVLQVCAQANKMGKAALFIDAEHALEPDRAVQLGCHRDKLAVYQPSSAEDAIDTLYHECVSGDYGIIVVDSAAALTPLAELEKSAGEHTVGLQARLLSTGLRKVAGVASSTGTCVIFTNQLRQKIGVTFGSPNTTPGGNALRFYTSMRVEVTRISTNKDSNERPISNTVRVKAVKNKMAEPYRQVDVELVYSLGYDNRGTVFDMAVEQGKVKRSGSWFSIGDRKLGQGRPTALAALSDADIAAIQEELTC
jgi:recombination protein RecA